MTVKVFEEGYVMNKSPFKKDMMGAHTSRTTAEAHCRQLEVLHGDGTHYVYIGSGSYRYQVRPTPWFKRKSTRPTPWFQPRPAIFNG
jgi:hypothetical protein